MGISKKKAPTLAAWEALKPDYLLNTDSHKRLSFSLYENRWQFLALNSSMMAGINTCTYTPEYEWRCYGLYCSAISLPAGFNSDIFT